MDTDNNASTSTTSYSQESTTQLLSKARESTNSNTSAIFPSGTTATGNSHVGVSQTGLTSSSTQPTSFHFGSASAAASTGFHFGSAAAVAPTGFQFGSASAVAPTGFQFGSASAVAPTGFQFGSASGLAPTGFQFGSASAAVPSSSSASAGTAGFVFNTPTTAAAPAIEFSRVFSDSYPTGWKIGSGAVSSTAAPQPPSANFSWGRGGGISNPSQPAFHNLGYQPDNYFSQHGRFVAKLASPPAEWSDASDQARKIAAEAFPQPMPVSVEEDNSCFRAWELGHQLVDAAAEGNLAKVQQLVSNGVPKNFARNDDVRQSARKSVSSNVIIVHDYLLWMKSVTRAGRR
jgi:hypothetical protein